MTNAFSASSLVANSTAGTWDKSVALGGGCRICPLCCGVPIGVLDEPPLTSLGIGEGRDDLIGVCKFHQKKINHTTSTYASAAAAAAAARSLACSALSRSSIIHNKYHAYTLYMDNLYTFVFLGYDPT